MTDTQVAVGREAISNLAAPVQLNGSGGHIAQNGSGESKAAVLNELLDKLQTRQATVGVLGMGYVGLPLVMAFAGAGFNTIGFDTNTKTLDALQHGISHIEDVPSDDVLAFRKSEKFRATNDFTALQQCDVAIICVPTPLTAMREPDLRAVKAATAAIRDNLRAGQLIVLESTTYPGTTDEEVRPMLEETGLLAGKDFLLAFSPERIDPGNVDFPIHKVPKVVGGHTAACLEAAVALYASVVEVPVPVTSTQAAELTKLLENIFRSVNIALVNELAMLCDRMKIDVWEVIEAAGTKPYGFTKFLPGPGLGGHCIPIDPFYLSWKARQYDFQTNFIELAGEVNSDMPTFVVNKIIRALNDSSTAVRGAKIGLLGLSYKPNVGDCRESPSLRVAELLLELGAEISYNDPYVESVNIEGHEFQNQSVEGITATDCVVLLTNHRAYDYEAIANSASLIMDTRNAFHKVESPKARIIKL